MSAERNEFARPARGSAPSLLGSMLILCGACAGPYVDERPEGVPDGATEDTPEGGADCGKCDGAVEGIWEGIEEAVVDVERSQPDRFTADFETFLNAEYGAFDFTLAPGYGGRESGDTDAPTQDPVVFVHGNADQAVGGTLGGWSNVITGLQTAGYTSRELYAFTWGPAELAGVSAQYHSREHLTRTRAFILAVLEYTGAERVDIISHSMGVTLARKAVVGGAGFDRLAGGAYDLGESLGERVDAFVGIAGANWGLVSCWYTGPTTPTCGATNGFYPGRSFGFVVYGRSAFLEDLNRDVERPGARIFSLWSPDDNIVGFGGVVWGRFTSQIPTQDGEVRLDDVGHFALRDRWADHLSLIRE